MTHCFWLKKVPPACHATTISIQKVVWFCLFIYWVTRRSGLSFFFRGRMTRSENRLFKHFFPRILSFVSRFHCEKVINLWGNFFKTTDAETRCLNSELQDCRLLGFQYTGVIRRCFAIPQKLYDELASLVGIEHFLH